MSSSSSDPRWSGNNMNLMIQQFNQVDAGPSAISREQYDRNLAIIDNERRRVHESMERLAFATMHNEIAFHGPVNVANRTLQNSSTPQLVGYNQSVQPMQPIEQQQQQQTTNRQLPAARIEEVENASITAQQNYASTSQAAQPIYSNYAPAPNRQPNFNYMYQYYQQPRHQQYHQQGTQSYHHAASSGQPRQVNTNMASSQAPVVQQYNAATAYPTVNQTFTIPLQTQGQSAPQQQPSSTSSTPTPTSAIPSQQAQQQQRQRPSAQPQRASTPQSQPSNLPQHAQGPTSNAQNARLQTQSHRNSHPIVQSQQTIVEPPSIPRANGTTLTHGSSHSIQRSQASTTTTPAVVQALSSQSTGTGQSPAGVRPRLPPPGSSFDSTQNMQTVRYNGQDGKVYTFMVPSAKMAELESVLKGGSQDATAKFLQPFLNEVAPIVRHGVAASGNATVQNAGTNSTVIDVDAQEDAGMCSSKRQPAHTPSATRPQTFQPANGFAASHTASTPDPPNLSQFPSSRISTTQGSSMAPNKTGVPAGISVGNHSAQDGIVITETPRTPARQVASSTAMTPASAHRKELVPLLLDQLKAELSDSEEEEEQPPAKRPRLEAISASNYHVDANEPTSGREPSKGVFSVHMPSQSIHSTVTQTPHFMPSQTGATSSVPLPTTVAINSTSASQSIPSGSSIANSSNTRPHTSSSTSIGTPSATRTNNGGNTSYVSNQAISVTNSNVPPPILPAPGWINKLTDMVKRPRSGDGVASGSSLAPQTTTTNDEGSPAKRQRLVLEVEIVPRHLQSPKGKGKASDQQEERLWERLLEDAQGRAGLYPCKWDDCMAILDNQEKLQKHILLLHACLEEEKTEENNVTYYCLWSDCRKCFKEIERFKRHLKRHAMATLRCPVQGCSHELGNSKNLFQHWQNQHKDATAEDLRQVPKLSKAHIKDPPVLPESLQSYYSTNLEVHASPLNGEHRKKLGPWVLRNIYGLTPEWRYDLMDRMFEPDMAEELRAHSQLAYDFLIRQPVERVPISEPLATHEATRFAEGRGEEFLDRVPRLRKEQTE